VKYERWGDRAGTRRFIEARAFFHSLQRFAGARHAGFHQVLSCQERRRKTTKKQPGRLVDRV
jgi:5-formaminoimidazole-4-carboxamide-1-beta-D-ribofuranosyl 5'-monophosphate synthetase